METRRLRPQETSTQLRKQIQGFDNLHLQSPTARNRVRMQHNVCPAYDLGDMSTALPGLKDRDIVLLTPQHRTICRAGFEARVTQNPTMPLRQNLSICPNPSGYCCVFELLFFAFDLL
jgi:hypothetical protein